MQLTSSNISKYVFNKNKPAKVHHVIAVTEQPGVIKSLSGHARVLDLSNNILVDDIEVTFEKVYRLVTDGNATYYTNISTDISEALLGLDAGDYRVSFFINILIDGAVDAQTYANYEFSLLDNALGLSVNAMHGDEISAESINEKLADVIMPGVLYGLDIIKGTGPDMFDLLPGAAMASNGMKLMVSERNYNILQGYEVPESGYRIDAVCMYSDGNMLVEKGEANNGQPVIDEFDKTVIAYMYLSDAMLSVSEAKIIKRTSISTDFNARKSRVYNLLLQASDSDENGDNATYYFNQEADPSSIAVYKNNKRLSRFAYDVIPGANTAIKPNSSLSSDVFMADFDLLNKPMPDDNYVFSKITPAAKAYPWDGAEILFRNAWLTGIRQPGDLILTGWNNTGSKSSNQMAISRFTQLSPNALLTQDNGMRLPINDANKINAIILLPTATKQPHTFVLFMKIAQLRDAMILSSNSYEPGAKFNFSINLHDILGDIKFVLGHCDLQAEHQAMADTPYMFAFRFDGSKASIFVNNTKLVDTNSTSFTGLDSLNEIYLKNEADPVIYYTGYWGEALLDSEIFEINNALHARQLV